MALVNGGFLGLLAYATYDLTNYATLRAWTATLTVVDVLYGTVATALVAAGAYAGCGSSPLGLDLRRIRRRASGGSG